MVNFSRKFASALALAALLALPGSGAQAVEISVTQWGASLYGIPFAVGMEEGQFKKAGVDITGIIGSAGGGTSVRNILASDTPYGEVATPAALAALKQGIDLVIVNSATHTVAESSLVTMPGSDIKGLEDLVGKKMSITSPKSTSEMVFLMELKAKGIDASKIQRIAAGGYTQGLTMLEQGAVAASVLIEPLSIIRKDNYRTVIRAKEILPPMTTSVGITTREFAAKNPAMIKAIIAGRREAVKSIYADPAKAANIVAKVFKMEPGLTKVAVENMVGPNMWTEGEFNIKELNTIAEGLQLIGELDAIPDWSKIIDKSYLPADLQAKQ
ncbi:MAG: transporter substrate-binding protein [Hyphomicrobiales bacterium]|jgi:NitT/TauT family transport system substrate-binding protein|nr:transporter substrate-binding protein [Hyphomicrobiales bacterium]